MPRPSSTFGKSLVIMCFLSVAVACLLVFLLSTSALPALESWIDGNYEATTYDVPAELLSQAAVERALYSDLMLYTKYSSAVYQSICPHPLGNALVKQVCFFSF